MLQSLSIKNVALIKDLKIDFSSGFNIILGETGAGKSILFDSLNFVLGTKADRNLIRSGEESMRVDAFFGNLKDNSLEALKNLGFEDSELLLSRTLTIDGKSSIRINGLPIPLTLLKEVGKVLVDSYSQHENMDLLKAKNHLIMLDKFGAEKVNNLKFAIKDQFKKYCEVINEISKFGNSEEDRERNKSLLEFQIKELKNADLKIGEDIIIQERLKFLNNAEKIYEAITICENLLYDNSFSCVSQLQQASQTLSSLNYFNDLLKCKERLDSARFEIEDVFETLKDVKNKTDFDQNEYDRLDRRNDLIKSLMKKYGNSIENCFNYLEDAKKKLDALEDFDIIINKLEKEKTEIITKLTELSDKLTIVRKSIAKDIENKIVNELSQLGMKSSKFEIKFSKLDNFTENGIDNVEFVFSANKGQEVKSLNKTASGGELSRFMLAIKNIFAENGSADTIMFDEIDAGISGETGKIVGEKLKKITNFAQVICITHLPQVACFGDDFYHVFKKEIENETITYVEKVLESQIPVQIAKMIVGKDITQTSLSQVKEMLNNCKKE